MQLGRSSVGARALRRSNARGRSPARRQSPASGSQAGNVLAKKCSSINVCLTLFGDASSPFLHKKLANARLLPLGNFDQIMQELEYRLDVFALRGDDGTATARPVPDSSTQLLSTQSRLHGLRDFGDRHKARSRPDGADQVRPRCFRKQCGSSKAMRCAWCEEVLRSRRSRACYRPALSSPSRRGRMASSVRSSYFRPYRERWLATRRRPSMSQAPVFASVIAPPVMRSMELT
jgi:hypothetical protein